MRFINLNLTLLAVVSCVAMIGAMPFNVGTDNIARNEMYVPSQ